MEPNLIPELVAEALERARLKLGIMPDTTDPAQLELFVVVIAMTIAGLEAQLRMSLPPALQNNVRAFIDQVSFKLSPTSSPSPTPTPAKPEETVDG